MKNSHSVATLASLSLLLLSGCGGDTSLRLAPDPLPDRFGDPVFAPGQDGPRGPGGPGGSGGGLPASPWGNLDPGDMPDTVFAMAWVDLIDGCVSCYYGPDAPDRYDLVDVSGQILSSFTVPFDWQEVMYTPPPLQGMHASGPGRFIVANTIYTGNSDALIVWEADGYTDETRVLAEVHPDRIDLPLTGQSYFFESPLWPSDVQVLPDPARPDSFLLVPTYSSPYLPTTMGEVWSLSWSDPEAPLLRWSVLTLSPELGALWSPFSSTTFARLADDGSGRVVLGADGWLVDEDGNGTAAAEVAVLDPQALSIVSEPVPSGLLNRGSHIIPSEDGTVILSPPVGCVGDFTWWEDGESVTFPLDESDWCAVLGPVLDLPSRTFAYATQSLDAEELYGSQRIVISANGQEVWSIETLRRGLSERPFHLFGVVALER